MDICYVINSQYKLKNGIKADFTLGLKYFTSSFHLVAESEIWGENKENFPKRSTICKYFKLVLNLDIMIL